MSSSRSRLSEMAAVKSEPKEGSSSAADSDLEGIANSDDSEPEETYEEARERQIAENRALLSQLGLDQLGLPPPVDDHLRVKREPKPPVDPASLRRNSRRQSQSASIVYNGRELKRRTFTGEYLDHRPERALAPPAIVYGHIPGIPVGRTWDYRAHLGEVHDGGLRVRSTNALQPAASLCIYSTTVSAANTAWQSALDSGDRFTFISAYGNYNFSDRERSGQVRDQTWGHEVHKALLRNVEEDREVRVIRGSKSESRWAPEEGFRYDGLYKVRSAGIIRSPITGKKVCTFDFQRLRGQPEIPRRGERRASERGFGQGDDVDSDADGSTAERLMVEGDLPMEVDRNQADLTGLDGPEPRAREGSSDTESDSGDEMAVALPRDGIEVADYEPSESEDETSVGRPRKRQRVSWRAGTSTAGSERGPAQGRKSGSNSAVARETGETDAAGGGSAEGPSVKRGPGRPRKVQVSADETPVKRGPGRPRKVYAAPASASVERSDGGPTVKRGSGRPRKVYATPASASA